MPNFYYTGANGQKQGAISPSQLKELVARGIITPDTLLETDSGHKGKAGQIKGLFPTPQAPSPFAAPVSVPMPSNVSMVDTEEGSESEYDDYDYRQIATVLRLSTWSILLFIFGNIIARIFIEVSGSMLLALVGLGIILGVISFSIVCMVRLAKLIHYANWEIVLFAITLPLPFLCFASYFGVYWRASTILKEAGYKFGFFGIDMRQFDDDDDYPH